MLKTVVFYLISGIIVEGLIADPADGTLEVSLRTIMAFSSIATLLLIIKKWHYFNQLFTAIFVCENFIMTLAIATEALDFVMVMKHVEYREEISNLFSRIISRVVYSDCKLYFATIIGIQNER